MKKISSIWQNRHNSPIPITNLIILSDAYIKNGVILKGGKGSSNTVHEDNYFIDIFCTRKEELLYLEEIAKLKKRYGYQVTKRITLHVE